MQRLPGNLELSWKFPRHFARAKGAYICFQLLKAFFDFSLNFEFPRFLTDFVTADYLIFIWHLFLKKTKPPPPPNQTNKNPQITTTTTKNYTNHHRHPKKTQQQQKNPTKIAWKKTPKPGA